MKNFSKKFIIISSFLFGVLQLSAQTISYDSIAEDNSRQDTLTFVEDFADAKYALNALFVSNDSLSFKLNKINANGAISATVADDTLTISALANGYGQASVEVVATNTADETTFSQLISVIVTAVDDAPTLNPDNRFVDYYSDQLSNDGTVVINTVNGFESIDADKDGTAITISFTNLSNAAAGYIDLTSEEVTASSDGTFSIAITAATKYAANVNITATSKGAASGAEQSFTHSVKLVVDNAPALIDAEDPITVNEDFTSFTKEANVLYADADNGDPDSIKVSFADYLVDSVTTNGEGIIENDTNNIVLVTYKIAEDEFTFTNQADKIGTTDFP